MQSRAEHAFWVRPRRNVLASTITPWVGRYWPIHSTIASVSHGFRHLLLAPFVGSRSSKNALALDAYRPDDCEVARSIFTLSGFSIIFINGDDIRFNRGPRDDAFGVNVVPRGFGDGDYVSAVTVANVENSAR